MPAGHADIFPSFCPADQKLTSPGLTRNKKAPRDSVGHVAAPFLAKGGASSARVGVLTDGLREPITVAGPRPSLPAFPPTPARQNCRPGYSPGPREGKHTPPPPDKAPGDHPVFPLGLRFCPHHAEPS